MGGLGGEADRSVEGKGCIAGSTKMRGLRGVAQVRDVGREAPRAVEGKCCIAAGTKMKGLREVAQMRDLGHKQVAFKAWRPRRLGTHVVLRLVLK